MAGADRRLWTGCERSACHISWWRCPSTAAVLDLHARHPLLALSREFHEKDAPAASRSVGAYIGTTYRACGFTETSPSPGFMLWKSVGARFIVMRAGRTSFVVPTSTDTKGTTGGGFAPGMSRMTRWPTDPTAEFGRFSAQRATRTTRDQIAWLATRRHTFTPK